MVRLKARIVAHPLLTVVLALAFTGVAAAAVPAFQATETPQFCRTCHEMGPYYDAWANGAHRSVSCVDCHVDPGAVNHVSHKVVAAKELWIHVAGDPTFPNGDAEVPNARCLRCHSDIPTSTGPRFSHRQHAQAGTCVGCHADAGHRVTDAALDAAGVLKPERRTAAARTAVATPASTGTAPATHVRVSCARCHDLAKVACATCHRPAHPDRGECTTCHRPGPRWSFSHPVSQDCARCHAAPARHFAAVCASCHSPSVPFAKTVFKHVSNECATCHTRPARHRAGACQTCHTKPGVSWAFTHPASTGCASCHAAPANHFGSSCATCHRVGVPFKSAVYRHTSSACASCHRPPANHNRAVACASCHTRPGVSWAATHPSSTACASCHRAPANHYGTTCSSCHKPLVAWSSAVFRHPATGGEHTYRSFACVKCHPGGYSTHTCTACHGAKGNDD